MVALCCREQRSGFTLIELAIVLVVIGILVTIAVPNLIAIQSRSKEAAVRQNCQTVALAAEDFCVQTGGIYPTSIMQMLPVFPNNSLLDNPFTKVLSEPRLGNAPLMGQIHYETIVNNGIPDSYVIRGGGQHNRVVITLTNGWM